MDRVRSSGVSCERTDVGDSQRRATGFSSFWLNNSVCRTSQSTSDELDTAYPLPHVEMPAYGVSLPHIPMPAGRAALGCRRLRFRPLGCLGGGEVEQLSLIHI